MEKVLYEGIRGIGRMIEEKEISIVELTSYFLERNERLQPEYNMNTALLKDRALERAQALQNEMEEKGVRGPLHGIPIAVKDLFDIEGLVNSSGSVFEKKKAEAHAAIIQKLEQAGANIIALNNLHEYAMGSTSENPHFGPIKNPWDAERIPGGSSGGSAVAVAIGSAVATIGTDTGGSIRLPAALCGVVGFKPTYDVVSREGCSPLSQSLDHIGPFARNVEDVRILLEALKEVDLPDSRIEKEKEKQPLKGVKIGVLEGYFLEGLHEDVTARLEETKTVFKSLGADILSLHLEDVDLALQCQRIISKVEAYSNHSERFTESAELFGKDVRYRLAQGREVKAYEYVQAKAFQKQFQEYVTEAMKLQGCDAVISATNAIAPFIIDMERDAEQSINNIFTLGKTSFGNFLGFPVVTVPCGLIEDRYPAGLQLMGLPKDDFTLLDIARLYEQESGWTSRLQRKLDKLMKERSEENVAGALSSGS